MMIRRELLIRIIGLASWSAIYPLRSFALGRKDSGAGDRPFNKEWLRAEAKRLALTPYVAPRETLPLWLADLDWDDYQSIRYKPERGLWVSEKLPFQVRLFHLGLFFHKPVT